MLAEIRNWTWGPERLPGRRDEEFSGQRGRASPRLPPPPPAAPLWPTFRCLHLFIARRWILLGTSCLRVLSVPVLFNTLSDCRIHADSSHSDASFMSSHSKSVSKRNTYLHYNVLTSFVLELLKDSSWTSFRRGLSKQGNTTGRSFLQSLFYKTLSGARWLIKPTNVSLLLSLHVV